MAKWTCKIVDFPAKLRRWRHAPWLTATTIITDSRHRFSKRWHVADVKNIAGNDQTMVHQNSANIACTFRLYVCLRLRGHDCCSAADGRGSCHAPASSYFEEMTRCRSKKLQWRWPGNPNGRSTYLGLFTFTRSQLTLRWWLLGWWRLSKIAQTARSRRQKQSQDDQVQSKFRKYENLCLRDQAKRLEKHSFCCYERRRDWQHCTLFFSCYHSQRLLFLHSKNNFLTILTPPKNRDIHIVGFFVDSIYSKTIDIIRKQIFFFLYFETEVIQLPGGMLRSYV